MAVAMAPSWRAAARRYHPMRECQAVTVLLGRLVVVLAVVFDYINGFHDTANAIATSVATRALRPRQAILMAAAFNFIGAFAGHGRRQDDRFGPRRRGDDDPDRGRRRAPRRDRLEPASPGWLGLPSSSSHALIGGLLGRDDRGRRDRRAARWTAIVGKVLVPMVISPLLGFIGAFALMLAIYWIFRRAHRRPLARALPAAPGPVGRVHGLHPRLQRRPEDDGDHHPRPVLGRRHPGRRRAGLGDRDRRRRALSLGTADRRLADHADDGPAGSSSSSRSTASPPRRPRPRSCSRPPTSGCPSRPPTSSRARSWASARARGRAASAGASPATSSSPGS